MHHRQIKLADRRRCLILYSMERYSHAGPGGGLNVMDAMGKLVLASLLALAVVGSAKAQVTNDSVPVPVNKPKTESVPVPAAW